MLACASICTLTSTAAEAEAWMTKSFVDDVGATEPLELVGAADELLGATLLVLLTAAATNVGVLDDVWVHHWSVEVWVHHWSVEV